jgi:prepilin-type N-terminal cleavage/methylation domain-containing protein
MSPVTGPISGKKGFTLLEILLVTGIILVIAAVIVPQAIRINTASKYNLVQQAAAEIGKWGLEWGERNLESQDAQDTCVLNDYIQTLGNAYVGNPGGVGNWVKVNTTPACRTSAAIAYAVASMVDPARQPRNPFNGLSYFAAGGGNGGTTMAAGLLYLASYTENTTSPPSHHYYFVYTGTDSENATQWHAGMGRGTSLALANMKNGIFMARLVE